MMNVFFDKVQNHKDQNLPFVIYRKPNANTVFALLQQNETVYKVLDYSEKGFVFASFDKKELVLIPESRSKNLEVALGEFSNKEFSFPQLDFQNHLKNDYENLVSKGIEAIKKGILKKVVLSRKEELLITDFNFIKVFQDLLQLYPTTLVYCFYHPKIGLWMGATPEQLLKAEGKMFTTTALAGTQKASDDKEVLWQQKEKEEQQFVTDFIKKRLKEVASSVVISQPYSIKAGSIWHIKTDISGVLNEESTLKEVVDLLHPTPAVCGLPKKKAKDFIVTNENYDRTFYTGFLGELNRRSDLNKENSDLYVNLRSMQILDNKAYLYMGCGITKESVPEKEWEESVNKSMTMKRVLKTY